MSIDRVHLFGNEFTSPLGLALCPVDCCNRIWDGVPEKVTISVEKKLANFCSDVRQCEVVGLGAWIA